MEIVNQWIIKSDEKFKNDEKFKSENVNDSSKNLHKSTRKLK